MNTLQQNSIAARRRHLPAILLILLVLVALLVLSHPVWLTFLYRILDVSAAPVPAQALVILGGEGGGWRAQTAAEIYDDVRPSVIVVGGSARSSEQDVQVLLQAGIPGSRIYNVSQGDSTYDEAMEVLGFLHRNAIDSAVLVTDAFHTSRARATYTCLDLWDHYGITLHFVASRHGVSYDEWWTNPITRKIILNEWAKRLLYIFEYGITCF